ncbi:unnamed protein product [Tetraodon nigroviridis]|uniref:(spotted green pufferfish) hypothetical protein n=1 Tax=Tetraodon nigroviridis TaxID=99883 RepID=Q4TF56_TETNG|nr:unnamed protein product [Tetraodon nigroviridis]
MAMEDEDVGSLADRTDAQTGAKKGGEPGDAGTCIDRQPDAVIHPAGGGSRLRTDLQLVLCSTSTTVEELCAQRDGRSLYVQLHGDLVR